MLQRMHLPKGETDCAERLLLEKYMIALHKKHYDRHLKPHFCLMTDCGRQEGFSTLSDLHRHLKSVNKVNTRAERGKWYRCVVLDCEFSEKWWPRKVNLKEHVERKHSEVIAEAAIGQ